MCLFAMAARLQRLQVANQPVFRCSGLSEEKKSNPRTKNRQHTITNHTIMPESAKRQRNRVPVSCLSCKKRKVKCDKAKPACGGCIRQGVGHLCQYIDPPWLGNNNENKGETVKKEKVEESETFRSMKNNQDRVILSQRKEIDNLKRRIAVLDQLGPRAHSDKEKVITVLKKLKLASKDKVEIDGDFVIKCDSKVDDDAVYIYSWINLIKLDPQLTTLWYKITNLQKIYHMYKMNMLKRDTKVQEHKKRKINEIDFTSVGRPSAHQNCPVIECDFNLMDDNKLTPVSRTPTPVDHHQSLRNNLLSLWDLTLRLVDKVDYKQLCFLLEYYFGQEEPRLLSFYKPEIQSVFKKHGDNIMLNIDRELTTKGVYLCMLSMIVLESLHELQTSQPPQFVSLFGSVYLKYTLRSTIKSLVNDFIAQVLPTQTSLSMLALTMTHLQSDSQSKFTNIYPIFLKSVLQSHLWTDPELIHSTRKQRNVKIHACQLWSNSIRLINRLDLGLATLKSNDDLIKFREKIEASESSNIHVNYLASVKHPGLSISLQVQYLIARVNRTVQQAMNSSVITIHGLESCITACTALMDDPGLVKLQATEKTEITRELQYLRWFLGYLVLLQEEEFDIKTNTLSKLFEYLYQFVNDLVNGTSYEDAVELLTRSIQCIVGLLIRAKENDTEISIMEYGTFKPSVFLSEYIIPRVNKLIDYLDSKLSHKMRLTKLAKLWKFHLTFIGNNSKAVNYAKIHAQVPGFQDKCPVIHEEQETSNIPIKQEFTRCPISQITSPQDLEIEKPRKRKCPFDHQSVRSSPAPFTESNLRGDKCPYVSPPSASTRTTSPLRPIAPAIPTQLPQLSPPPLPAPPPRPPSTPARAPAPCATPPVIVQPVVPAVPEPPNEVLIVNNEFEDMFDFSQFADLDLDFLINENFTEVI